VPVALLLGLLGYLLRRTGKKHDDVAERSSVQPNRGAHKGGGSELASALASCRWAFAYTALFSGASNILMLTGSIFMLQVYDRILPSPSVPTLVAPSILAVSLFIFQGIIDLVRGRILVRIGAALDEPLSGRVYETIVRLPLKAGHKSDGLQPLRDLDTVRSFLSGVVTAGEAIMLIVPRTDKLIVEARVAPQDIDQVRPGQSAMLRFSAFNQRTTPEIKGTVNRVSADAVNDQRTGLTYYTVRIALPPEEVARLGNVTLLPGMPVEAFIQTAERKVLSYILKPLQDQMTKAFREK
jgi:hypothetical protein